MIYGIQAAHHHAYYICMCISTTDMYAGLITSWLCIQLHCVHAYNIGSRHCLHRHAH